MASKQRATPIALRTMVPIIPEQEREHAQLEKDFKKMRCKGLLAQPWALKDKSMVKEVATTPPNTFDNTIQSRLEEWSWEFGGESIPFQKEAQGWHPGATST